MKYIVPVEDWRWEEEKKNPPGMFFGSMAERLIDLNGGTLFDNLHRAHYQLIDFLSLAVRTAKRKKVSLSEVEIISPQLSYVSGWCSYMSSSGDCTWGKLTDWFEEKYGMDFVIQIDANSFSTENKKSYEVAINFLQKTSEDQDHTIQA